MSTQIIIFGASGHGKVILTCLRSIQLTNSILFIDDFPKVDFIDGIQVVHKNQITSFENKHLIIAVGCNKTRRKISKSINPNYISVIHSTACISEYSELGIGTVVMPKVVVNPGTIIGMHCIINSAAVVEHDCQIADFCHIAPNASLAGNVSVGEGSHIGIGAVVIQGVKIGKWTTIGAGAVIIHDVPDFAVVVGNPGKIIKHTTFENIC
jgi:sugar O-acyltransferase (sialic acid O-acetyltransferase NeuD family)